MVLVVSRTWQAVVVYGGNLQLNVAGAIGPDHICCLVSRPVRSGHVIRYAVQGSKEFRAVFDELDLDIVIGLHRPILGNEGLESCPSVGGNVDALGGPPGFHAEIHTIKNGIGHHAFRSSTGGPPITRSHSIACVAIGNVGPVKRQGPLCFGGGPIHIGGAEVSISRSRSPRGTIESKILEVERRERLCRARARQIIEIVLAAHWVLTLSSGIYTPVWIIDGRRSTVGTSRLVQATTASGWDIHTGLLVVTYAVHVGIHAIATDANVVHPGLLYFAGLRLRTITGARDFDLKRGAAQTRRCQRITLSDEAIRIRVHQGLHPVDDGIELYALSVLEPVVVENQRRDVHVEVAADVDAGAKPDTSILVLVPIESIPRPTGGERIDVKITNTRARIGPLTICAGVGRGTKRSTGGLVLEVLEINGRRNRIAHHGHRGDRGLGNTVRIRDAKGHAVRPCARKVEARSKGRVRLRSQLYFTGEGAIVCGGIERAVRRLQGRGS